MELNTLADLLAWLSTERPPAKLIALDGMHGVGKSTLARALCQPLRATLIELDTFLKPKQDAYVSALKIPEIQSAMRAATAPVIVEGICLLNALAVLGVAVEVFIYVKQVDSHGYWDDAQLCEPTEPAAVLVERCESSARSMAAALGDSPPEPSALRSEVIHYHCDFRPLSRADVVYVVSAAA